MDKFLTIAQAAKILGISTSTLRRWERENKLFPEERTEGNHRRYKLSSLKPNLCKNGGVRRTIAYARVSSHDQKDDLERQKQLLELFCASNGWSYELLSDLGSGLNYHKKGLKKLIQEILSEGIERLVLTNKDRLLRFGSELIFSLCERKNIEVVLLNRGLESTFEEDLAKDVLEIITVFSARLYGSRSHKTKKMLKDMSKVVKNATDS